MWTDTNTTILVEGGRHQLPGVPGALGVECEPLPGDREGVVCSVPDASRPADAGEQLSRVLGHLEGRASVLADMASGQMRVGIRVEGNVDTDRTLVVDHAALLTAARLGIGLSFTARTDTKNSEDELADALGW